ncbi:hypothetical protein J4573_44695 [Actinomadura barringtoniae]|uniref:Uncharacterized protein n=1 Tax=Actinomadura barringtoniae TaxID=1427535 RepID=A0A939TC70_9ACTN|nr:hypothetical protein [Actinomadura barringtoniae]MBO2454252.1 hypothetical protein [Actinomadura barringtoniae]
MPIFSRPSFTLWSRKLQAAQPAISAARLERFLDLSRPAEPAAQLRQLLLVVFLLTPLSPEEITEHAQRRWDLHPDKTAELQRGEVEFGFRWYSINGVLTDCGASQAFIDKARELFHDFSRQDIAPGQLASGPEDTTSTGDQAPEDDESTGERQDDVAEEHKEETDLADAATTKPDPATAKNRAELLALLPAFRTWKGRRSYRNMEKAIDKRYVHSTLSEVPKRTNLPSLDLVLAYIEGCGGDDDDLIAWEEAWRRIAMAERRNSPGADPGRT